MQVGQSGTSMQGATHDVACTLVTNGLLSQCSCKPFVAIHGGFGGGGVLRTKRDIPKPQDDRTPYQLPGALPKNEHRTIRCWPQNSSLPPLCCWRGWHMRGRMVLVGGVHLWDSEGVLCLPWFMSEGGGKLRGPGSQPKLLPGTASRENTFALLLTLATRTSTIVDVLQCNYSWRYVHVPPAHCYQLQSSLLCSIH